MKKRESIPRSVALRAFAIALTLPIAVTLVTITAITAFPSIALALTASHSRGGAQTRLGPGEETASFGRFGTVALYHHSPHPSRVVLFVSGDGGWNQGVVDMARELATLDALVIGIDITHYLKELESSTEKCSYPASDFEDLSKFVQEKLDYPAYITPVLVGYSSGATLVYAILVQAPSNTFRGALSLGFCPDLEVSKPFCPGNGLQSRPGPKGKGVIFSPATTLEVPFVALQGTIDQVCFPDSTVAFVHRTKNGRVIVLPKVGHGYSVPRNWMPQFKEAFASIMGSAPVDAPMARSDDLKDLPLVEVAAQDPGSGSAAADSAARDAIVIEVTGDGGWGVTDKGLASTLSAEGFPVVGLNSLHYFWNEKTPDQASLDLARLMEHYLSTWKKEKAILIGYSYGAEVLPFMYNRLSADLQRRIPLVVLLAPSPHADFHFHVVDWLGKNGGGSRYPVVPEIAQIAGPRILCFYGADEGDSACRQCDPAKVTSIQYGGGHRIGGRFEEIARRIIEAAP